MHQTKFRRGRRLIARAVPVTIAAVAVTAFAPSALLSSASAAGVLTTNTTVSANPATSNVGQNVTLTSSTTITGLNSAGVTPTGTVTFSVDDTVLGTSPMDSCVLTPCVATFQTTALPRGDHTVTATYNGDSVTSGSSGTTPVSVHLVATEGSQSHTTCAAGQPCDTGTLYADDGSATLRVQATPSRGQDTIDAYLGGNVLPCTTPNAGELGNYTVSANDVQKTISYSIFGNAATAFHNAHPTTPPPHLCYLSTLRFNGYYPSNGHWTGTSSDYAGGVRPVPYNSQYHGYLGLLPQCNANRSNSPCVISQTYTPASGSNPPQVSWVLDEEPVNRDCDPHIGG